MWCGVAMGGDVRSEKHEKRSVRRRLITKLSTPFPGFVVGHIWMDDGYAIRQAFLSARRPILFARTSAA